MGADASRCALGSRGNRMPTGPVAPPSSRGNVLAFSVCLPWALPVPEATPVDWAVVFYLAVFQIGAAYFCLLRGIRELRALEISLLLSIEPVASGVCAWLVHGEIPGTMALIGCSLIFSSVLFASVTQRSDTPTRRIETRSPTAPLGAASLPDRILGHRAGEQCPFDRLSLVAMYDLIIIGAGPAGLSMAAEARAAGISADKILILEKGEAHSWSIRKFYPEKKLVEANYKGKPAVCSGVLCIPDLSKDETLTYLDQGHRAA